jgi:hypothetical protein
MIPNAMEFVNSQFDKGESTSRESLMKEFAIEILKYNLKQYKLYNTSVTITGGKTKTIDEITLETIKELEK